MASQTAIGSGATKNNSMTVFGAGNFTSGNITNSLTQITNNSGKEDPSPKPSLATGSVGSSGNVGTAKALSAGTFAYDTPSNKWIMKRVTTTLSGVSKTQLLSGASDFDTGKPENPTVLEGTRRYNIENWIYPSGWAVYGASRGASVTFADGVGGNASDNAARPTRSVPGEFTYKTAAYAPVNDDYSPRTG